MQVEGMNIFVDDLVGSTGMELKADPGVPYVYAGFAGERKQSAVHVSALNACGKQSLIPCRSLQACAQHPLHRLQVARKLMLPAMLSCSLRR